jgi:hypothetical protein
MMMSMRAFGNDIESDVPVAQHHGIDGNL